MCSQEHKSLAEVVDVLPSSALEIAVDVRMHVCVSTCCCVLIRKEAVSHFWKHQAHMSAQRCIRLDSFP